LAYVVRVAHDAVVALVATHKIGVVPFSMTRLGHDFLIRKHTFTEAHASAVDAVWFADRVDPLAFDPNLTKGSAMRYVLGLAVQLLAMLLEIAGTIWLALFWFCDDEPESDPRHEYFSNVGNDDGYDQFGSPMTPGEEACSLVRRKHWL
jgi:hypothetical protein